MFLFHVFDNTGMALQEKTISEQLMYSTVRIEVGNRCGTGFFYKLDTERHSIIVISNRHLAEKASNLQDLDFSKSEIVQDTQFQVRTSSNPNYVVKQNIKWFLHPTEDLAFFDFTSLLSTIPGAQFICIDNSYIPPQTELDNLSALEKVAMIGYPNGIYDSVHNLPIFRTGYTAFHPAIDYAGRKHGLIDVACLPGSSGSPVFILEEGMYSDKKSGKSYLGNRVMFLGIENSAATITRPTYWQANGASTEIANIYTEQFMNLGWYIKSSEISGFNHIIATNNL